MCAPCPCHGRLGVACANPRDTLLHNPHSQVTDLHAAHGLEQLELLLQVGEQQDVVHPQVHDVAADGGGGGVLGE